MAGYTLLRSGSTGEDVKKLQNALIGAGYDVGKSGSDGIYGANTESAVRKYQQDNGLSVDGIAGEQTMGKLFGNMNKPSVQGAETQGTQSPVPDYSQYQYDPTANKAYLEALAALQQAQKTMPTYQGTYDQQLQDLYEQIVNREKFSYDLNADALYQQYRDQYTQQGKLAMMDTMGQAQAMTGGYGNSYAQSVGQQTYQGYLQQLNDVVPELYGMALDQYNQEGQNLLNQYSMLGDLADTEYARYQDALDQYWQNLTYQKQLVDDAYDQGYTNWYQSYQMGADADNTAYQKQQDAYEKLVSLITSTGYTPTEEELKAAGMSSSQAKSYADYYKKQNGDSGGSSGGSSYGSESGSGGYDNGGLSDSQVKALQKALGVTADGMYGSQSKKAAGGLSAKEAYEKYVVGGEQEQNVQQETGVQQEPTGFTGTTYNEAVAYMKNNGVPNAKASNLMTSSEWSRRRDSYKRTGVGGTEVKNYNSYAEYIADFVEYAIESYGK